MSKRKVIVTIAPTGGMAHKSQNPHLPTQPAEIAADVLRCWNAGASGDLLLAHLVEHARLSLGVEVREPARNLEQARDGQR